jgi:hypothetical protein
MRQAFMSIEKAFMTCSEDVARVAVDAQPGDSGACRRG